MIDDEVGPARLKHCEHRPVQLVGLVMPHELVGVVVIVLRSENHIARLGRRQVGRRLHVDRQVGVIRARGQLAHDLDVGLSDIGVGFGPDGVDVPLGANQRAEDTRPVSAAGDQIEHLVAGLEAGEGDHLGRVAVFVACAVQVAPRVGDRLGDRAGRDHRSLGEAVLLLGGGVLRGAAGGQCRGKRRDKSEPGYRVTHRRSPGGGCELSRRRARAQERFYEKSKGAVRRRGSPRSAHCPG